MAKTTVLEVDKTTQTLSLIGELIETAGTTQLTTEGNFESPEFIEGTTFKIKSDGTVEAGEFIEQWYGYGGNYGVDDTK